MKTFPRHFALALLSVAVVLAAGCKSNQNSAGNDNAANVQNPTEDPANANIAPISNASTQSNPPSGSSTYPAQQSDQYAGEPYPPDQAGGSYDNSDSDSYDQPVDYAPQPPPELPQYDQPPCPGDGYMWTPGYWGYASAGYYWVPGAWVYAPYPGALWTPGYWGWIGPRHSYGWHPGYWGRHIGYYGGINYGFGYIGFGYQGGYWNGDHFAYNRTVNNVNLSVVHNVYNYRVVNNNVTRVSYNGPGGVQARPRPAEMVAIREQHTPPMTAQVQQARAAQDNRASFASVNHGRPQEVTVARPLPADHDIHPPAPVPMRQPAAPTNTGRPGQPALQQRENQPQPRANQPAPARNEPAPRHQEPTPQRPQQPAPAQHPERQQPAPERQAPQQHAQPAPERQNPTPQRPAPTEHPAQQPHQEQRPAPQPHAAPRPAPPEHKNPPPRKPEDKRPQ